MRLIIAFLVMCPLLGSAQSDSITDFSRALEAYVSSYGEVCVAHTVDSTTSLDAVATMYGSSIGHIYRANRLLQFRPPQKGDLLDIPVDLSASLALFAQGENYQPVIYRVRKGETLFRIARQYFDLSVDLLMQLNHLESPDLSIAQPILLGYLQITDASLASVPDSILVQENDTLALDPFVDAETFNDKGVALWNKEHPEFQQLFAMHRTARVNSMLEITNPMFDRTVLVKVVGKIPRTFSDDIMIVISPGVARKLGAIDSRFYVTVRYLK